jgi:hypothetical protein
VPKWKLRHGEIDECAGRLRDGNYDKWGAAGDFAFLIHFVGDSLKRHPVNNVISSSPRSIVACTLSAYSHKVSSNPMLACTGLGEGLALASSVAEEAKSNG